MARPAVAQVSVDQRDSRSPRSEHDTPSPAENATRPGDLAKFWDKAEAYRVYAAQVLKSQDAQNAAAAIKLRAQRRGGELLRDMAEHGERRTRGGDTTAKSQRTTLDAPYLADLGVSKSDSLRWQAIASLPEPAFDKYVAETTEAGGEVPQSRLAVHVLATSVDYAAAALAS